ncbi:uroporphyrinogen-III synthase [Altibacter sp.]|uniref:uroporphyrinogen-III synthase n=1 Tax=Altibacter sp. TaxID=2024823 RepID=UPI0025885D1D|nr:uroporphyrinogen-III synthase [Altibacter sp.]MCW9038116.1 uroporphyrinogen-III synthase [Altibacter sp.]
MSQNNGTILSTKKLSVAQKELFLGAGFGLVEYNAIKIQILNFSAPKSIKNAIFSSKNAIKAIKIHRPVLFDNNIENCFCVGESTTMLLAKNGQKVTKTAQYASELAEYLVNNHKNKVFYFFCGTERLEELPATLKKAEMTLFEVKTYKTELNLKQFHQNFDGILFFSPSGVRSFMQQNELGPGIAICIGKTTASEAKKYTEHVVVATTTSVESVIAKAVKTLKELEKK